MNRVWLFSLLLFVSRTTGFSAEVAPAAPDFTVALKIGHQTVSRYVVGRLYERLRERISSEQHRAPNAAEKADWLARLLVQETLIAHAIDLGYLDRPEVVTVVDRMKQYMLTKVDGPYYQSLLRDVSLPTEPLIDLAREAQTPQPMVIARFDSEAAATRNLGADFDQLALDQQIERMRKCRLIPGVEVVEGNLTWPYGPAAVVAETARKCEIGRWTVASDSDFGVYYILKKAPAEPHAAVAKVPDGFPDFLLAMKRDIAIRRHYAKILKSADFRFDQPTAEKALFFWSNAGPLHDGQLRPLPGALGADTLFRYSLDGRAVSVSVAAFRDYYDARIVRQVIKTVDHLRQGAQDFVLEQADLKAAVAAGLDRTEQFQTERAAFASFQALDVFEKTTLMPRIAITDAAIQRYYDSHRQQFERQNAVAGQSAPSVAAAHSSIQHLLAQESLQQLEAGMARQWAQLLPVEDRLDYASFGLNPAQVAKPWDPISKTAAIP